MTHGLNEVWAKTYRIQQVVCVRVHVTQITALWNGKENPSQFKLMTWLLFWSGWGFARSLCLLLPRGVSAWGWAFLHCSQRAWPRPSEEDEKVTQREECDCMCLFTLWNLCPGLSPFSYTALSFSYPLFCSFISWKMCGKRGILF